MKRSRNGRAFQCEHGKVVRWLGPGGEGTNTGYERFNEFAAIASTIGGAIGGAAKLRA